MYNEWRQIFAHSLPALCRTTYFEDQALRSRRAAPSDMSDRDQDGVSSKSGCAQGADVPRFVAPTSTIGVQAFLQAHTKTRHASLCRCFRDAQSSSSKQEHYCCHRRRVVGCFRCVSSVSVAYGARVTAILGIPTFRGAGGLWRKHNATSLATPEAFKKDPGLVWQFYQYRRDV